MAELPLPLAQEHVVLVTRAHWARYVASGCVCLLLLLVGVLFIVLAASIELMALAAGILYLLGATLVLLAYHKFFHMFFSERMRTIIVTSKRVIYLHLRLYLAAHEHEIPLRRIHDVSVRRVGLITYLLNFGSICFEAPVNREESLERCLPYVPHPDRVGETIAGLLPAAIEGSVFQEND